MTVKNYFLLCPVIYISLLLVSCANDTKSKLIGKWQLIRDSISCDNPQIDSLEAAAKGKIQSPQASLVLEAGREVQEGETLVFSKDDSYEQSVGKIALPGKYKVIQDSALLLTIPTGISINIVRGAYVINSIGKDTLKMTRSISMKDHSHTYVEVFQRKQ